MSAVRFRRLVVLYTLLLLWAVLGCTPPAGPGDDGAGRVYAQVFLLGTELLEPPAITTGDVVFKPTLVIDIDDQDFSAGQAAGFFVTLAADEPNAVRFELADLEAGALTAFEYVAAPVAAGKQATGDDLRLTEGPIRRLLAEGRGAVWPAGSEPGSRFAVLVPQSRLSAFTKLKMYTDMAEDGTPIGAAEIELVRDFFHLAVIGDSVVWGNGLLEEDKMSALAAEVIQRETGRRVIQQRYAQSGARIVPAEGDSIREFGWGEVPTASTSITVQAELIQRPELVDLILMNGCMNDVGVTTIIDPRTTDEELAQLSQRFCYYEMAELLRKVRDLAPQASIAVTGYYQIVGPQSDLLALRAWSSARGVFTEEVQAGGETLLSELVRQSAVFHDTAHQSLRAAVDLVNQQTGAARIAFADPAFGPENAIFTPHKWLWSLTAESGTLADLDLEFQLYPEDPIQAARAGSCFGPDVLDGPIICVYASVGHPNRRGARAYADAVIGALRSLGVLPAAATGV